MALSGHPVISVIILNYDGMAWIRRCLESLQSQTIYDRIEVIIADNKSKDGSDTLSRDLISRWPNGIFIQNGGNLGFCEGNNVPARQARGEFLFFLNNDTWLEPDCLEKLVAGMRKHQAVAGTPLVLNYEDDTLQLAFGRGFDIFGLGCILDRTDDRVELFMPPGCSYIIRRDWFEKLGGFDREIFLYSDEYDLSWRVWLAGGNCVLIQDARLHHRSAANVNPIGGEKIVEFRTSDSKRFFANRNGLMVVLKNAQHILLLMFVTQILLLFVEMFAALMLVRRWSFIQNAYLHAFADCWRLRQHIIEERRRIKTLRKRSDFWMLRFLCAQPNRWEEIKRILRLGLPRVSAK